ncbi:MAG: hypothetical protein KIT84_34595 [Labilithrix sp.]|nr:hypothetical protein [Labilithrix sp.]MCW5816178.1 hypothetical protein [Labilithrix sp.]
MSEGRYQGFSYPEGLLVLDSLTGEVTLVPADGTAPRRLHGPALAAASAVPAPPPSSRDAGALDRAVVETYPYPVAIIYARLLEERDARQRCRLLVDTFATLLKIWAIALASDYLRQPDLRDANLNELLARDFQRPLISTWHLFIVRALTVFRTEGRTPFLAELPAAYDTLELKCRTPFLARTRFEDARGGARTRESKLGKIQALIKYRNGLAHGYNLPVARAEQDFATYQPVLAEILSEARFMTKYPLHADGVALVGARPSGERTSTDAQVWLADPRRDATLPLEAISALEVPEDASHAVSGLERDLFFFEGNTRSAMLYASALGEQVEKQHPVERWRALLEAKAIDVQVQRKDRLDLAGLRAAGERVTRATLSALVASGKYLPEIGFRPAGVADLVTQLELGDHRGVVFAGDNGSGKSTLVASIASERLAAGDVVLFYRASALLDPDLQARVVRDLGVRDLFFEDLLVAADPLFSDGTRLRVIVDGVNEHPGEIAALVAAIDAMVKQATDHPWFRLVATIATAAAERLPHDARFGNAFGARWLTAGPERSVLVPMPPLADTEVGVLYERYRAWTPPPEREDERAFRPLTSFEELAAGGRSTVAMMRSPLMLRLLASAFDGKPLDPELSYDEAMRLYFEQVVVGGARWDRAAFLKALVVELDAVSSDTIARDALYDVPALKRSVQNTQKDSVYVQLLDLGILTEQWDRDRCLVRFGFARLFEHLLADLHAPRTREAYGVLELARRSSWFAPLGGAASSTLAAQCRAGDTAVLVQALGLADAMDPAAMERGALHLVARAVIDRLAREAGPLERVLAAFAAHPTGLGLKVLLGAFDVLFAQGEVASAMAIAVTASEIAAAREDGLGVAQARYGRARIHHQRGELDEASALFGEVRAAAQVHGEGASLLARRAAIKEGEILRARGRAEEARALFEEAADALQALGAIADAAEARRQQAITAEAQRRLDDARAIAKDALALAERAGNPSVETQCLLSSGVFAWKAGDLASATLAYERALRLAEAEGHARNVAVVLANLGILAHERGEWSSAVEYTARQHAMAERIENRSLIASSLQNLGVFRFEAGDVEGASRSLERAQAAFTALGEHAHVATSLVNQAAIALHRGAAREAASMLATAIDLGREHENPDARLDALWLRANLALDEGDRAAARSWRDTFAAERPDSARRGAQLAALDLRFDPSSPPARWTEIRAAFDDARPLPEVHELPIDAALALGDPAAATVALAWLRGRPHRHRDVLAVRSRVASSA